MMITLVINDTEITITRIDEGIRVQSGLFVDITIPEGQARELMWFLMDNLPQTEADRPL